MSRTPVKTVNYMRLQYRSILDRAALWGVEPPIFNNRVRARLGAKAAMAQPSQWVGVAQLEIFDIAGYKCCPKAVGNPCVCTSSWRCEIHGVTCHGTHD